MVLATRRSLRYAPEMLEQHSDKTFPATAVQGRWSPKTCKQTQNDVSQPGEGFKHDRLMQQNSAYRE